MRTAAGLSGVQLAARVPLSGSALSRIETGQAGPPPDETIAALAAALETDRSTLMHLAGRSIDPDAFEQRVLVALGRLLDQQRAGFDRVEAALARRRCGCEGNDAAD